MSKVTKRSIVIADHKTSISLEDEFWSSLREIALTQGARIQAVVAEIDSRRTHENLSCAIRLFVLNYYRERARMAPHPGVVTGGDRLEARSLSPSIETSKTHFEDQDARAGLNQMACFIASADGDAPRSVDSCPSSDRHQH